MSNCLAENSKTSCLGRKVKWVGKDGGWKTGRVIQFSCGIEAKLSALQQHGSGPAIALVKEDHCGTITEAELSSLQPWPDVEYCSRCTKEKNKCECLLPMRNDPLEQYMICEKKASIPKTFKEVSTDKELADVLYGPPVSIIPRSEWAKHIEEKEQERSKRQLRALNHNYQVLFGKSTCTVPQERVTLEEVLNSGDTFCYLVM